MKSLTLKNGLTGSTLKLIAIITMFIDHIGAALLEPYLMAHWNGTSRIPHFELLFQIDWVLRLIGRVAFPIFIFLLLEGFSHTHNKKKYGLNLFLFALLSEIPFDFAFNGSFFDSTYQNVMFTLLFGYLCIWIYESDVKFFHNPFLKILGIIFFIVLGNVMKTDYGAFGVFTIILLYYMKKHKKYFYPVGVFLFLWEVTAPLAFLIIHKYNGTRGLKLKYFFYLFYPVHILLLGCIRIFILKC